MAEKSGRKQSAISLKVKLELLLNAVDEKGRSKTDSCTEFPVPTISEMWKCIISMRRYLDVHSKGEMNQTMDDIEQYVDNMMINKTVQKKITDFFTKIH